MCGTFCSGCCVGPVLPGFKYNSEGGAHASPIIWTFPRNTFNPNAQLLDMHCYFNGGGYFQPLDGADYMNMDHHLVAKSQNYSVLATYKDVPGKKAAAVKCEVGEGMAIMSGVHFEYLHADLDKEDEFLKERGVIAKLEASEPQWKECLERILTLLGLNLCKQNTV